MGATSSGNSWSVVDKARRRKTRLVDIILCAVAVTSESSPASRFSKYLFRADINILRPSPVIFAPTLCVESFLCWRDFPGIHAGQWRVKDTRIGGGGVWSRRNFIRFSLGDSELHDGGLVRSVI